MTNAAKLKLKLDELRVSTAFYAYNGLDIVELGDEDVMILSNDDSESYIGSAGNALNALSGIEPVNTEKGIELIWNALQMVEV